MRPPALQNLLRHAAVAGLGVVLVAPALANEGALAGSTAPPLAVPAPGAPEPPFAGPVWSVGPVVGGGMLVGVVVEVQTSRSVWLEGALGTRVGLSTTSLYPNVALTGGVNTGWGKRSVRNGVFGSVGASAPLGFFDAWVAGGWSMEVFGKSRGRVMNFQLGPAVYLLRDLPPETDLSWPGYLYLRASFPFTVGGARPGGAAGR